MTKVGISIDTRELAKIAESLDIMPAFKSGMYAAGIYLKGVISEYPSSSSANQPKPYPGRWYERGYGTRYIKKSGGMGGKKTSETLGKRWTVKKSNAGMTVTVGNNTSYGKWVQGHNTQAQFHKVRNWKTTGDVADKEGEKVKTIIMDFISAKIDGR
ncbi:MAG: hypothetical protein LC128_05990 [Chitinophagales bacterium]|nr:hypothetical protein [Chitinophagales bacterium]